MPSSRDDYVAWDKKAVDLLEEMEGSFLAELANHQAEGGFKEPSNVVPDGDPWDYLNEPGGPIPKALEGDSEGLPESFDTISESAVKPFDPKGTFRIVFTRTMVVGYMKAYVDLIDGDDPEAEVLLLDLAGAIVRHMSDAAMEAGWLDEWMNGGEI